MIHNIMMNAKSEYTTLAFLCCLHRHGVLMCEACGVTDEAVLVAHHVDGKKNGLRRNLQVLCANCHHRTHWENSVKRRRGIAVAKRAFSTLTPEVRQHIIDAQS